MRNPQKPNNIAVIITDSAFVLPTTILILSLKKHQPLQKVHVLGISLSEDEKRRFNQFDGVRVFDASIPRSNRPGAMRIIADILKTEALLTARDAEEPWVALMDSDCIATGDLTPYLQPEKPGLYARSRSSQEDTAIFSYYRRPTDSKKGIPESFMERWQADVGERESPARDRTVLSGNLVIHRDYLDFCISWGERMKQVLSYEKPESNPPEYYMPAEFVLTAQLMFGHKSPPVYPVLLNSNPDAFLAHLGPHPKYWELWTVKNLRHFDAVTRLVEQAKKEGFELPELPYALKKHNKLMVIVLAYLYEGARSARQVQKRWVQHLRGNRQHKQTQRYIRQTR